MAESKEELRIVLLGKTGTGKSRTGNTILGLSCGPGDGHDAFEFALKGSSLTKFCIEKEHERFGRKIRVVDTPGVFDTDKKMNNHKTQEEIKKCILYTYPGPHVLALTIPFGRFTNEDVLTVKHYIQYFGYDLLDYVIVIFTKLDSWENDYKDRKKEVPKIEDFIKTLPEYPKKFLECCKNRFVTINNRNEDDDEQVKKLFSVIDQMNKDNNHQCYTNENYDQAAEIVKKFSDRRELVRKMEDSNWLMKIFYFIKLRIHKPPRDHFLFRESDLQIPH